ASGAVFVYDVQAMDKVVTNPKNAQLLKRYGVDDIDPAGGKFGHNIDVDFQAAYALDTATIRFFTPQFKVYGGDPRHYPIGLGGAAHGLAGQDDFLHLLNPTVHNRQPLPEFQWKFDVDPEEIKSQKLYVSVFSAGQGLFPDDLTDAGGNDLNPNRILTEEDRTQFTDQGGGVYSFTLPANRKLTAGQT